MVTLFIPSYNRPSQCFALLESIKLHDTKNLFSEIYVAWDGTTDKLYEGYQKLINHPLVSNVNFYRKSNSHYTDIMKSIDNAGDYWAISTDDSVFFRDFEITQSLDKLFTSDIFCFTFRAGYNVPDVDYEHSEEKNLLSGTEIEDMVKFYWPNHRGHFGHIFATDSTLMRTELIKTLIIRSCSPAHFSYRHFECKVMEYLRMNPNWPFALCHKESSLVNSPTNLVTTGPYVKNGVKYGFTVEELNEKWLAGYKLDIRKIQKEDITSCQQELPFEFIKE